MMLLTNDEVWQRLEAMSGFNEAMEEGVAQIAAGKSYTLRRDPNTRSFTWPMIQPKPSWWRRLLRRFR